MTGEMTAATQAQSQGRTPFRAALPWLAAGLVVLVLGGVLASMLRPELLLFAAIPAVALFIVGGLVWSRGPA